jgi:hypothetical protein
MIAQTKRHDIPEETSATMARMAELPSANIALFPNKLRFSSGVNIYYFHTCSFAPYTQGVVKPAGVMPSVS